MKPTNGHNTRRDRRHSRRGAVLGMVLVMMVLLSLVGLGLLDLSAADAFEAAKAVQLEQSFWLAEAGVQRARARLADDNIDDVYGASLGRGSYDIEVYNDESPPRAVITGTAGSQTRQIEINYKYLAAMYEAAVWAGMNVVTPWQLDLRGAGTPTMSGGREQGGADEVHGDVYVHGDVALHEESNVYPPPAPNEAGYAGDVNATGEITVDPTAGVAGAQHSGADPSSPPDLVGMGYATNNTHDIAAIFDSYGILSGRLPWGHELYDVVVKNPTDRAEECASTSGDDFFFEPTTVSRDRDPKDARSALNMGDGRVYYVDGHVWFHHNDTYGFELNTRSTIVSTRNIHISDNLKYASDDDLLGLVALGQYDLSGDLVAGTGDVYFGDPEYGTMYRASAFMFAAGHFLYNMDSTDTDRYEEPETGFEVFGNFAAMQSVTVNRDWYDYETTEYREGRWAWSGWRLVWIPAGEVAVTRRRPATYDTATGVWKDAVDTDRVLTPEEVATLDHYRMIVKYDERIRNPETQPPGLPRSTGRGLFGGITAWKLLPSSGA